MPHLDYAEFAKRHGVELDVDELQVPASKDEKALAELDVPWKLADLDMYDNYMDDDLYWLDVKFRELIHSSQWIGRVKKKPMRVSTGSVFEVLFGRPMKPGTDTAIGKRLSRILEYYAARTTGRTKVGGKSVNHSYWFNSTTGKYRRPYSIRLALEEADGDTDKVFKWVHAADNRYGSQKRNTGQKPRDFDEL